MTCDHIEPLLAAYLDGELTPQEEARVADCLAQNGDLRREAEQLAAARDHLTQMMTASMVAAEAPHAAWPGIAARLDQTGPATNRHNPAVDTPRRDALRRQPASGLLAPLFAAGTAALLLVLVGLVVWNGFALGAASVGAIETPTLVPESTPVPAPIERIAGPSGDPAVPAPAAAADGPFEAITVAFGDVARLEGYRIGDRLADGRLVVDLLWWVAGDAPGLNEVMLVQDADGNLVMQFEADLPASGPAQYVLRTEGLPPGDYTLLVGVTDRADRIPAGDAPQAVAVFTVDGAPQAEELATPTLTINGFTEAVLDTAALPTYPLPVGGGGGGGGGGGCPSDQGRAVLLETVWVRQVLCLTELALAGEAALTVELIDPGRTTYEARYTVLDDGTVRPVEGGVQPADVAADGTPDRLNWLWLHLYTPPILDYGEWTVRVRTAETVLLEETIEVAAGEPVFSVTSVDAQVDPFVGIEQAELAYQSGDQVVIAGQGFEPGTRFPLALYAPRGEQMVPFYAREITVSANGSFRAVFVVGEETPALDYTVVFNPQPGAFEPFPWHPTGFVPGPWVAVTVTE